MKFKITLFLLCSIILLFFFQKREFFYLNSFALYQGKTLLGTNSRKIENSYVIKRNENSLICHFYWLDTLKDFSQRQNILNAKELDRLLGCNFIFARMLSSLFPITQELAEKLIVLYPEETLPYYWLALSYNPNYSQVTKPFYEKILEINPKEGLAWRYLGIILIQEGNTSEAINAHINCCKYGDPGSNGCYNAGRLLEQEGQYLEAIYYYRLSKWLPSQKEGDRLEAQLSSGELIQ